MDLARTRKPKMSIKMSGNIAVWRITPGADTSAGVEQVDMQPGSLDEGARLLPAGGYTTFRTFGRTHVLRLQNHFQRLEETARLAGKAVLIDQSRLRRGLRYALAAYPAGETRVRVVLDLERQPGTLYLLVEGLLTPKPEAYENGACVVTRRMQRNNPKAKLTNFIETASSIRRELPVGIEEAIMIGEDGRVLEGLSSNFFAVLDGAIWTADQGVLSGITRSFVLDVVKAEGIPLQLEALPQADLNGLEEAFITSASRAVLPVVEIDGRPVANGKPGPITRRLLQGYLNRLVQDLEVV
jgi:branched-chain amino acid aminotransferase